MKFIEITDGISINLDRITFIKRLDEGKTQIESDGTLYEVAIPYSTFRALLSRTLKPESDALEQLARFQTHWAG